jgi:hypothetical protein
VLALVSALDYAIIFTPPITTVSAANKPIADGFISNFLHV